MRIVSGVMHFMHGLLVCEAAVAGQLLQLRHWDLSS